MTAQIEGTGALADAPEAEKHVDISRFQDSNPSGLRLQPNRIVRRSLIDLFAVPIVRHLAGSRPCVFRPILFEVESEARRYFLELGFSYTDALIGGENLRTIAFDELELIWDNLTWAKGGRRPGWSIHSQPEQLSKL